MNSKMPINHFHIYKHHKYNIWVFKQANIFIFNLLSFYEQLIFHAELSWAYNLGARTQTVCHLVSILDHIINKIKNCSKQCIYKLKI